MTPHVQLMKDVSDVLADDALTLKVIQDYVETFVGIGISRNAAATLVFRLIRILRDSGTIYEAERQVRTLFSTVEAGNIGLLDLIEVGHEDRIEILYKQVWAELPRHGKLLDYGCGSGRLADMIAKKTSLAVEGADVIDFLVKGVNLPFHFLQTSTVPVPDAHYDCVLATNVLHHARNNEAVLKELGRITKTKLVIIETFASGETEAELASDWGRVFMNDVLWNRFFNYADIPVPGTYDTRDNWIRRIMQYGFGESKYIDFGIDQPMMRDRHQLMVFTKA